MSHTKTITIALGALLASMTASQAAFAQDPGMQSGSMQNKPMMHNKMMGHDNMMEMWTAMDTNKDGFVSKSEHAAYMDSMFTKMDTNGDGKLSKEEMQTGMKMMHH